jgi:hypothetical protein
MGVDERSLRTWFGRQLITEAGFRSQTSSGPDTPGIDSGELLRALEDHYLIRSDERNGTRWYELSHDRLVDPVLENNTRWWRRHASPWELRARDWAQTGRNPHHLLYDAELREARQWLDAQHRPSMEVSEFVEASRAALRSRTLRQRFGTAIALLSAVVLIQALVIVALLVAR